MTISNAISNLVESFPIMLSSCIFVFASKSAPIGQNLIHLLSTGKGFHLVATITYAFDEGATVLNYYACEAASNPLSSTKTVSALNNADADCCNIFGFSCHIVKLNFSFARRRWLYFTTIWLSVFRALSFYQHSCACCLFFASCVMLGWVGYSGKV